MAREVYWHLPGLCSLRFLNFILLNLMEKYPDKFREGYKIASVYGTFPGAIWNGGRAVHGKADIDDIAKIISIYNQRGIPVRFTWTNSLLEERHMDDSYCNQIMKLADNGMNQVLVNQQVLEDYIRRGYPYYKVISSTTKRIVDKEALEKELSKDYHLVVLDYDLNHSEKVLSQLQSHSDKIEILVNEICQPGCKLRQEHYRMESKAQLEADKVSIFECPNAGKRREFAECMKRPSFISNEEITSYVERGFVNFKIVGRGLPLEFVKESYLYFLVKDEEQAFIREKMDSTLMLLRKQGA